MPLALVLSVIGFVICGHPYLWSPFGNRGPRFLPGFRLNLEDLARHGRIEHDGSLCHADTPAGEDYAPTEYDPNLLQRFLSAATGHVVLSLYHEQQDGEQNALTMQDIARVRLIRNKELTKPFDAFHHEITMGEAALIFLTFAVPTEPGSKEKKEKEVVPREWVRQWFEEERLPMDWKAPKERIGIVNAAKLNRKMIAEANKLDKGN